MAVVASDQVAKAFVHFHHEDGLRREILPPLEKVKLHKMVYYAQAYWLGQKDERLFDDCEIVAEFMGPSIDGLPKAAALGDGTTSDLPERVAKFLRGIHDALKKYSGLELFDMTHEPGEPWSVIEEIHEGDLSSRPVIPADLIRSIFSVKVYRMRRLAA